jgi:hypothetical protein
MAYLTRSEAIGRIAAVLRGLDDFLLRERDFFSRDAHISQIGSENRRIVRDGPLMQDMLMKLDDGALAEMYKRCITNNREVTIVYGDAQ